MKIWRVQVDRPNSRYREQSTHLVHAATATHAIRKAVWQAKREGSAKVYDATSLELVGDSV